MVDGMDQSSVSQQLEQLVKKGESLPRCAEKMRTKRLRGQDECRNS